MPSAIVFLCLFQINVVFAATQGGYWHPGIGDPTILGWVTTVVYLLAVICTYKQMVASKVGGGDARFWLILTITLILLGINKQLDLQTWLTEVVRTDAQAQGWYAARRLVQAAFVIFLGLSMLVALGSLYLLSENSRWRRYKLVWIGMLLLCMFVLMRAATFHHVDIYINTHFSGFKFLIETGALLLIILGTFFHQKELHPTMINTKVSKN